MTEASRYTEANRLRALARVAGAAAHEGGLDGVLTAIAEGVQEAFGFLAVVNWLDEERDVYTVRVTVGEGVDSLQATTNPREAFEELLDPDYEIVPDVFFIPHEAGVTGEHLGEIYTPDHSWPGPGYWHPLDMCFIRLRTSDGKNLGILSVDSPDTRPVPDARTWELLRLFAMIGANAAENVLLAREVAEFDVEREMFELRAAAERRYRLLFTNNPTPMWVFDVGTLAFLDVNEAAVRHYGYSREEFLGMTIADIRPPEDVPALQESLEEARAAVADEGTWRHRKKDGAIILVDITTQALDLESGPARLVVANDVTERELAERKVHEALAAEREASARLRALDEMKNAFLNAVSHELRTPLTGLMGSALTLEHNPSLTPTERRELTRAIGNTARKLHRLLTDLLDLDRLTRGVVAPQRQATDVGALVRSLIDELDVPNARPITIDVSQVVVHVDPAKLERIIENLVTNTIRHTPDRTPIWITASVIDDDLLLTVEDAGPGVPEELREEIFEPFRQVGGERSHSPGVGIGLSLVSRFAALHGGRAWVEERPGGGASFKVFLPSKDPAEPTRSTDPAPAEVS
jgi:PAS domain S-box-containing protein